MCVLSRMINDRPHPPSQGPIRFRTCIFILSLAVRIDRETLQYSVHIEARPWRRSISNTSSLLFHSVRRASSNKDH